MVLFIFIFIVPLLYGIEMTVSFCFFSIISFNTEYIDSSCNHLHFEVAVTLFGCVIADSLECGLTDFYIYMY